MTTAVKFDDATFADIQRRFREGRPEEARKRRRHSRCDLVISLHADIERLLNEGYSYEGIAEYLRTLDVVIPVATLKNYVGRARRNAANSESPLPSRHREAGDASRKLATNSGTRAPAPLRDTSRTRSKTTEKSASKRARETPPSVADQQSERREPGTDGRGLVEQRGSEVPATTQADATRTATRVVAGAASTGDGRPDTSTLEGEEREREPTIPTVTLLSVPPSAAANEGEAELTSDAAGSSSPGPQNAHRTIESSHLDAPRGSDLATPGLARLRSGRSSPIQNAFIPRLDKEI